MRLGQQLDVRPGGVQPKRRKCDECSGPTAPRGGEEQKNSLCGGVPTTYAAQEEKAQRLGWVTRCRGPGGWGKVLRRKHNFLSQSAKPLGTEHCRGHDRKKGPLRFSRQRGYKERPGEHISNIQGQKLTISWEGSVRKTREGRMCICERGTFYH